MFPWLRPLEVFPHETNAQEMRHEESHETFEEPSDKTHVRPVLLILLLSSHGRKKGYLLIQSYEGAFSVFFGCFLCFLFCCWISFVGTTGGCGVNASAL